jgi:hypothetical protein
MEIRLIRPWLGDQAAVLFGPALDAVRRRRWQQLWLGPVAAALVTGLALAFRTRSGHAFVEEYANTRPRDVLAWLVPRLPLSMFAPAALLPFWFAVVQVTLVFSLAQTLIGTRRTILVAFVGHAAATLSAYLWIFVPPPVGVGHGYDHYADAGPSAAVVALLAYLAVALRLVWLVVGVLAYDAIEVSVLGGLSEYEHLVGALCGMALGALTLLANRRARAPGALPGRQRRSGAPDRDPTRA